MLRSMKSLGGLVAALALAACVSNRMTAAPEPAIVTAPPADKAVVVFLRPSTFAFGIQSSVFDVTENPPTFIGIVSSTSKIAYASPPGARRFMVVSESADFMDAELESGKTYYSLVTPRMGAWKARFSLRPVHSGDSELDEQLQSCTWIDNTPSSIEWARRAEANVVRKRDENLPRWLEKDDRPKLYILDAR